VSPEPGSRLDVVITKWGDRPHWEFAVTYLGEDENGTWFGLPTGTSFRRPGAFFTSTNDQVTLVPREGWWVATFHGPGGTTWEDLAGAALDLYVDMTTPAEIDGSTVRCTDLDLDVIRGANGMVLVDDEDEFAEHQVAFDYPPEVVHAAEEACASVLAAVSARTPPFDGAASGVWLGRVAAP
jgi:predicted RNA-binding protein associated with RNAse of E/G family